jgi:hypothetical protein
MALTTGSRSPTSLKSRSTSHIILQRLPLANTHVVFDQGTAHIVKIEIRSHRTGGRPSGHHFLNP